VTAATGRAARRRWAGDVMTWPIAGRFLKWRRARLALQIPLFLIAALIVFDGLVGPQLPPKNLATVAVWLHYRGVVVLALLVAGNLFCMACPFMLPRRAGRWVRERLHGGGRQWPRALRNKWLTVGLIVLFFFAYEHFDLWATPWWTAWVAVGYFAVALVVDSVFPGANFCKHVCPLGQFNFFGSLVSPWEIRVREPAVCGECRTKDCITAQPERAVSASHETLAAEPGYRIIPRLAASRDSRGCELALFQPRKVGNMDCTFCLDCVHACPHDNIGLIARIPSAELWRDPFRSGVGRLSRRWDLVTLIVLFTFGAYLNAFAMIRPVYALQEALARALATSSALPGLILLFGLGLVVAPVTLMCSAALASRTLGGGARSWQALVGRYAPSLVPMGFGMWVAHYAFHFLTGALTIVPVLQSFLGDVGLYAGEPNWTLGPVVPQSWLFPIEAVMLYAGAFGSIVAAFKIAQVETEAGRTDPLRALGAAAPWIGLTLLLLGIGLWILLQPMEMRGTMMMLTGG
jgi:ferredoxin